MQRHGDGEAATGLCASGLWDNWDSKQGASVTVAALRACGADGCQLCTMLRDIVSQLKPGWLSEPKNHDALVAVKRRERWQFNTTLTSLGTAAIRLVEGSQSVAHLQLYRPISGKLLAPFWVPRESSEPLVVESRL